MRLDKLISNNTSFSRKKITKIIKSNNVKVNNEIINNPSFKVDENKDEIYINNEKILIHNNLFIVLNKPKGYVCSNLDIDGDSIFHLIEESYVKDLHIVGRLDKDTTGLVIITNDGEFTHKIKSSKYNVEKEYEVTLESDFTDKMHNVLKQDITLDGKKLKPFKLTNIDNNKLNITLIEGKYHQIKRMFDIVNNPVVNLKRIRINNLHIENLKINEGEYTLIDIGDFHF
ncbi:MAG: rRNA pseudouridine synthase [Mycoplasma sp.]|nr:rRNA pseudouridine synthase [Mycoplasma sp.]